MIKNIIFLLGFTLAGLMPSFAQDTGHNNDVWFHYFGKNKLSDKWSFSFEATMRYANGVSEKQQYFVRPSIDYQLTKKLMVSVGYSHYETYVYGDPALNKTEIPENHYWLQGTFVHTSGNWKFTHRLRDENRMVGVAVGTLQPDGSKAYNIDHYDYRNRLRYMFTINYPLMKKDGATQLFAILGDEAFMNIGANAGATFMNQNRAIGGFGYNFNPHHQIQVSYIHQNIWNYTNTLQENNPTVRISYFTNFDWYSKKK